MDDRTDGPFPERYQIILQSDRGYKTMVSSSISDPSFLATYRTSLINFPLQSSNQITSSFPSLQSHDATMIVEKLKAAGHEIIEWELSDQNEIAQLIVNHFTQKMSRGRLSSILQMGKHRLVRYLKLLGTVPEGLRMLYEDSVREISTSEL